MANSKLESGIWRSDVGVEGARSRGDEHLVDGFDPGFVVRGRLVFGGGVGIAVDLDEDEACGVVLLLEEFEAGDAGLPGAVLGVDGGGGLEGVDEFGFDVGVDDEDLHRFIVESKAVLAKAQRTQRKP